MSVHQPAWVARTAQTRADIVASALALFHRDGFDATTVEQIADAAGVARRTFFHYFPTKDAVLFSEFTLRQALEDPGSSTSLGCDASVGVARTTSPSSPVLLEPRG